MKNIVFLISLFSAVVSWSHPQNSDSVYGIPVGSVITFSNINILPNTTSKNIFKDETVTSNGRYCALHYRASQVDRILSGNFEVRSSEVFSSGGINNVPYYDGYTGIHYHMKKDKEDKRDALVLYCNSDLITILELRTALNYFGSTLKFSLPIPF